MIENAEILAEELLEFEQLMQDITEENQEDFLSFVELLSLAKNEGTLVADTSTFYH
jgi:hypothetical protein